MNRAGCKVQTIPQRDPSEPSSLTAHAYPNLIPDGEYIAHCTHVHHDQHSRNYGERVYLDFQIYLGDYAGKSIRMFLRPSGFPTSNYYRAWSIAHGGPPRSRNTKMCPRVFKGKLFRLLTTTVKPKHRITGEDGKSRPGPVLPESFWYSKVACLLSLETTNDYLDFASIAGGGESPDPRVFLTDFSENPFSTRDLSEGKVGRRELGDGSKREHEFAVRDGTSITTLHNKPAEKSSLSAPSPSFETPRSNEKCKRNLRERGGLP